MNKKRKLQDAAVKDLTIKLLNTLSTENVRDKAYMLSIIILDTIEGVIEVLDVKESDEFEKHIHRLMGSYMGLLGSNLEDV